MHIQEVMKTTGITRKALQYYEDKGLIHVEKDASNYRDYDEECLHRLWEIKVLRRLDFSISEIERIMKKEQRDMIFNEHFNDIDKRMAQCIIQKTYIQQLYDELEITQDGDLLKEMDQQIEDDFRRNEEINVDLHKRKGHFITVLILFAWIAYGTYLCISYRDEGRLLGIFIIIIPIVYMNYYFKRNVLIQPQSPLGVMVDDGIYKVRELIKKRRNRP